MTGIARLDDLIEELEASPDDEASQRVFRALETFLDVQRTAFGRVIEILRAEGHAGIVDRFLEDPLLATILRGYRLVEPDVEEKVSDAVEALGYGGRVRVIGVRSGVARFEVAADRDEWMQIKQAVDRAIRAAVPELVGVAIARAQPAARAGGALPVLGSPALTPPGLPTGGVTPGWIPLVHWWTLEASGREKVALFESEVVVYAVDGRAFAFEDRCPAGGESLETAALEGSVVRCAEHALAWDLRTGESLEQPGAPLGVLATRVEDGVVKIESPGTRRVQ